MDVNTDEADHNLNIPIIPPSYSDSSSVVSRVSKRTSISTELNSDKWLNSALCCDNDCCINIAFTPALTALRDGLIGKKLLEKHSYIVQYCTQYAVLSNNGKLEMQLRIGDFIVCQSAFLRAVGITRSTFYRIRKKIKDNLTVTLSRNLATNKLSNAMDQVNKRADAGTLESGESKSAEISGTKI